MGKTKGTPRKPEAARSRRAEACRALGITNPRAVHMNLGAATLYEQAVARGEGAVADGGPLVVCTGRHTGRSPDDKFIVKEGSSADKIGWGSVNRPFDADRFDALFRRVRTYLEGRDLFVQDCVAGADPVFRLPIRIVTDTAWQSLFARHMFIRPSAEELETHAAEFTVVAVPNFAADPPRDGTNSDAFIIISFDRRLVLIGGTHYAGEIKKSIFSVLNYLLPQRGVLSMHASVNVAADGNAAVFFGMSGTGKTTLSADPERALIGDDEHGWGDRGLFNLEGGCYAKVIRLSPEGEPEIYATTRRFATILENVTMDPDTRRLNLDDDTLTENTRAAYPVSFIPNADPTERCGHPSTIIMLAADAFGVLPPISRLTRDQAIYHFMSGYTAKVAGTEAGVTEPVATFSSCFGAPFMALPPAQYARLLAEKIDRSGVVVWLVNTGWIGGPYGVGRRMPLAHTRAMVRAALGRVLNDAPTDLDPILGLNVPRNCPDVPSEMLQPRSTWSDGAAYDRQARDLARRFAANFEQFTSSVTPAVRDAGPHG